MHLPLGALLIPRTVCGTGDGKADLVGFASDGAVYVALSTGTKFDVPRRWATRRLNVWIYL